MKKTTILGKLSLETLHLRKQDYAGKVYRDPLKRQLPKKILPKEYLIYSKKCISTQYKHMTWNKIYSLLDNQDRNGYNFFFLAILLVLLKHYYAITYPFYNIF